MSDVEKLTSVMVDARDFIESGDAVHAAQLLRPHLDTDQAPVHALMGAALFQLGDYTGSLREFERASTLEPDRASYKSDEARVLERLGEGRRAELLYRRALEIDPGCQSATDALRRLHPSEPAEGSEPGLANTLVGAPTCVHSPGVKPITVAQGVRPPEALGAPPILSDSGGFAGYGSQGYGSVGGLFNPLATQVNLRLSGNAVAGPVGFVAPGWRTAGLVLFLLFAGILVFGTRGCESLRALFLYHQANCRILSATISSSYSYSGRYRSSRYSYRPYITFTYFANGSQYTTTGYDVSASSYSSIGALAIANHYRVGDVYPCWYDPANPTRAVLVRSFDWGSVFSFLFFGLIVALRFLRLNGRPIW